MLGQIVGPHIAGIAELGLRQDKRPLGFHCSGLQCKGDFLLCVLVIHTKTYIQTQTRALGFKCFAGDPEEREQGRKHRTKFTNSS